MKKTRQNLSLETFFSPSPFGVTPPRPAHFTVMLKLHRDLGSAPRKLTVEHLASPRSSILLKIIGTRRRSGQALRLDRRRQLCDRLRFI